MKGNGNGVGTILQKLWFMALPTCGMRSKYIMKHAHEFKHIGGGIFWQSRKYPADPEKIALGNNVLITAGVTFVNHDVIGSLLNKKYGTTNFCNGEGCIEIGDNVMIGTNAVIMPNVRIGSNVIIGAGAIVTKDIPDGSVAAGVPCRVIGSFDTLAEKYKNKEALTTNECWNEFYEKREKSC